ncbi:MAG: hypothetical protein ACI4LI_03235 [Candidatus Fimenecus sp.]
MENKDVFSGLSVDKILAEVKEQKGEKLHLWSMDEIDKLLADENDAQPQSAAVPLPHTVQTEAVSSPAEATASGADGVPESAEPFGFANLKATARHAAQVSEVAEDLTAIESQQPTESEKTEAAEQPKPLLEGAVPQTPAPAPQPAENSAPETPLPGQISIEKTRVFNEVEAHAVHNADIAHHIGQPILRTTTGEFDPVPPPKKPSAMETDAQRERFLNRPEQKLEKTMEHKELLSKLPPKTIERPGVIVRKAPGQVTGSDGLQAIPTLVLPEDELKAQRETETKVQAGTLKSAAYAAAQEAEDAPLADQMMLEGFDNAEEPVEQIDEAEAEISLLKRRREKAKKFRLFPGLETEDTAEDETGETEYTDTTDIDIDTEKTRVQPDFSEPATETDSADGADFAATDGETDGEIDRAVANDRKKAKKQAAPITVLREFYGPKDGRAVYDIFLTEKRGSTVRLIVFAVLTAAAVFASLSVRLFGDFTLFNGNASVYSAVNLVFLVLAALLSLQELKTALTGLFAGRITAETGLFSALVFALVQVGVSYAFPEKLTVVPLYTAVALFVYALYFAGKKRKLKNDICNFETVAQNFDRFYTVGKIEDTETAFEIGRGLLLGDPDVRYSKRISFPSHFVEISKRNDRASGIYALALPAATVAAGVIGAITCFTSGDVFTGVSAMCAVAIAGLPMSATLVTAASMRAVNRRLLREGALTASFDAAAEVTAANAVVLDAAELFDAANCRLRGMKMYHKMRVDEALLYTAAMTIQSGGTLSAVFDGVILHKREMLPQVESLAYEERLGCSGWIYNQRVLVGNRDLLLKHNVDAPTREEEQRFRKDGCEVIYLAVEGKIAALFVVEYAANERLCGYLQDLEKYGISILIRTTDPNITEGLIEQYFSLPHNLVKIISPVAGKMFRDLTEETPQPADCGVLHNGRITAFLRAFLSAFVLEEKTKLAQILLYIGVGLSITLLAVLSFFTALTQAGAFEILVFELLWTAISVLVPNAKKV